MRLPETWLAFCCNHFLSYMWNTQGPISSTVAELVFESGSSATFCSWIFWEDSPFRTRGSTPYWWMPRKIAAGKECSSFRNCSHQENCCLSLYFSLPLTRWIRDNKSLNIWRSASYVLILFSQYSLIQKKIN